LPEPPIIEIGMRLRFVVPLAKSIVLKEHSKKDARAHSRGAQSMIKSSAQSDAQPTAVLTALSASPLSAAGIMSVIGLKTKTGAFKRTIRDLLEQALIEYTIPEKPNSHLQRYRLTDSGRDMVAAELLPAG
jgi:ATP-dependent DNA helicase RecG